VPPKQVVHPESIPRANGRPWPGPINRRLLFEARCAADAPIAPRPTESFPFLLSEGAGRQGDAFGTPIVTGWAYFGRFWGRTAANPTIRAHNRNSLERRPARPIIHDLLRPHRSLDLRDCSLGRCSTKPAPRRTSITPRDGLEAGAHRVEKKNCHGPRDPPGVPQKKP